MLEHYGVRTLLYGTLLPGPDIGRRCQDVLRATRAAGFEIGVHCWDHVRWQDFVTKRDAEWTEREMERAVARFAEIFGEGPRTWGAAGWQLNRHAAWYEERHFPYASDTRGTGRSNSTLSELTGARRRRRRSQIRSAPCGL